MGQTQESRWKGWSKINHLLNKQEMEGLTYKAAVLEAYDDFYKIKCDSENVKWSGFATAPDYYGMREWYERQLGSKTRIIYLCYLNGNICGFFYLDKISGDEIEAASSRISSEYIGRSIGNYIVDKRNEIAEKEGDSTFSSTQ